MLRLKFLVRKPLVLRVGFYERALCWWFDLFRSRPLRGYFCAKLVQMLAVVFDIVPKFSEDGETAHHPLAIALDSGHDKLLWIRPVEICRFILNEIRTFEVQNILKCSHNKEEIKFLESYKIVRQKRMTRSVIK